MSQSYLNRQIDDFFLEDLIGRRASMELYRATQQSLKRFVLLKIIFLNGISLKSAQLVQEFRQYVSVAIALEDLHLQPIYGFGVVDDDHIYVAGKIMSHTLHDMLHAGALPLDRALELTLQMALGIAYIYDHGLVHSALSPRTVYISASGDAYIDDLELSRIVHEVDSLEKLKDFLDEPFYASVEQLQCTSQDFRSEVYSFGAVLYHMVTGSAPFADNDSSFERVLERKLRDQVIPPRRLNPAISPDLETLILQSLRANPNERLADAPSLEYELRRLILAIAPTPVARSLLEKLQNLISRR